MTKGNWGMPERIWGLEPTYDAGRVLQIYDAIKPLPIKSVVDIACGTGIIGDCLSWVGYQVRLFDIVSYPEWKHLRVFPGILNVYNFLEEVTRYDLVLFLNSYRNWDDKELFNDWLKNHASYFITSGDGPNNNYKVIGKDVKNHDLKLYTL